MGVKNRRFVFVVSFIFTICSVYSQISFPGKPSGAERKYKHLVHYIELAQPKNQNSNNQNRKYKPSIFAEAVNVNFSPANCGSWDSSGIAYNIWRVGICSPGVSSIGVLFNKFEILPGTKIYLYTPSGNDIHGAYTYRNNNRYNLLAVEPVMDDSVIIEMQLLKGTKEYGELFIKQLGLGFPKSDHLKGTNDRWYGTSADCHLNVNCYADQPTSVQKHSVCKIIYNNTSRCTGTLINNTENDARPLVLTASHCISDQKTASSAVYVFDYESPACENEDVPAKSISGSKLLATNQLLDFSLLELNEEIPIDYHPVFAGWDATTNPFSKTTTIHHPEGDIKKVTVNYNPVIDGSDYDPYYNGFWLLHDYELGSTEAGSSGSALFDSVFHIRGTLTSGGDVCQSLIEDYYARFDRSYNYYSDYSQQLAYWLDPLNTSVKSYHGYIPADPFLDYGQQLSNIESTDSLISDRLKNGWGYPSGINSNGNTEYAEHFYCNGSKYIYAVKLGLAKAFTFYSSSKMILKIWDGINFPENLIYKKEILLFELLNNDTNLIRLDTSIYVNQNFFVGYEIISPNFSDSLAFYYSDPILKKSKNTAFTKLNNSWVPLSDGQNNLSTSLAIFPLVYNFYIEPEDEPGIFPFGDFTLYPNPATGHIQILFKEKPQGDVTYKIFDVYGREVVFRGNSNIESNFSIDISGLSQGIYFLKVYTYNAVYKKKFVKLN